jgi:hypothetical protein
MKRYILLFLCLNVFGSAYTQKVPIDTLIVNPIDIPIGNPIIGNPIGNPKKSSDRSRDSEQFIPLSKRNKYAKLH